MDVTRMAPLTFNRVYNILSSTHISAEEKEEFFRLNSVEINELLVGRINTSAFQHIMQARPLILFKPLKNSYTKAGDKRILAKTLGIPVSEVNDYIAGLAENIEDGNYQDIPKDKLDIAKTYVYRHGTKEELLAFLDYELKSTKEILGVLYRTLQYNTGGAADYFVRPIHRMNNSTLYKMYDIVDDNLRDAARAGAISEVDRERTAQWALVRIYEIQNNQKIKNALKLKKKLET